MEVLDVYKTLLPTLCLFACTGIVHAQRPYSPPNPSANLPGSRIDINALTEEQRAREFVRKMRILRGADSPTNQPAIVTLSDQQLARLRELRLNLVFQPSIEKNPHAVIGAAFSQDWPTSLNSRGVTFGGRDPSQGAFSPLGEIRLDLKPIDLAGLTVDLEALKGLSNLPMSPVPPNPPCVADQNLPVQLPALASSRGPVRAQASGLKEKVIKSAVPFLPCTWQCQHFYKNCSDSSNGPKGRWKDPRACEKGREKCKETCRGGAPD